MIAYIEVHKYYFRTIMTEGYHVIKLTEWKI